MHLLKWIVILAFLFYLVAPAFLRKMEEGFRLAHIPVEMRVTEEGDSDQEQMKQVW